MKKVLSVLTVLLLLTMLMGLSYIKEIPIEYDLTIGAQKLNCTYSASVTHLKPDLSFSSQEVNYTPAPVYNDVYERPTEEPSRPGPPPEPIFNESDVLALGQIATKEAGGECDLGIRLVIDTVLNRVDDSHFPSSIREVIYQNDADTGLQFTPTANSNFSRTIVTERIRELVISELTSRTNYDVMYFRARSYLRYGTPLFVVGAHYFSSN